MNEAEIKVTELILIRHGQTVWNLQGRHQGHVDSDLSELGVRQARAVAERLAILPFSALYSSDLKRAYHPAKFIARKTGHSILVDPRLRERNYGIFRGLTLGEIQARYPAEYARFRSGDPDYVVPEGESARQKFDRAVECLQAIVRANLGRRAVVVTHGGVLDAAFRYAVGLPLSIPRRVKLYNASLNTFFVHGKTWMLGTWGDTHHLREMETIDEEA